MTTLNVDPWIFGTTMGSNEKCCVNGCENSYGDGTIYEIKIEGGLLKAICAPCFRMLTSGTINPSDAWFSKEISHLNMEVIRLNKELLEYKEAFKI